MSPWQQHSRCHFVSFGKYVSGAKGPFIFYEVEGAGGIF